MPTVYALKPAFQNTLRPTARALARAGITPNAITIAGLALSAGAGLWLSAMPAAQAPLIAMPVVFILRMALNALDGMLAREHHQTSNAGVVLNEIGDVVSDIALYLPFALVPGLNAGLVVIVVLLGVLTEVAGVVAVQTGAGRRYDGPMGKSDRAAAFGVLAIGLATGRALGVGEASLAAAAANGVLIAISALLALTTLNRARAAAGGRS